MIIKHPLVSEKAVFQAENENKFYFIVDRNARRDQVKREVERLYKLEVKKVNIMLSPLGEKKAIVTFEKKDAATELAGRIGVF